MIKAKEIGNNPQRYKLEGDVWQVSAVADSPNSNSTKEIKVLEFPFGKIKPVLVTDGIVVLLSSGELLCSPNTLKSISDFKNPHWDITPNGKIKIKDKEITLGSSIPVIRLDINNLTQSALSSKKGNSIAGVESVEWIFEGEKMDGIPVNLINQIDWTLTEGVDKRGDTFGIWDWKLSPDSVYSIEPILVSTTQEDGKFDKAKLDTFLKEINSRLNALNSDFAAIKNTFYKGDTPPNSGVKKFKRIVAQTTDDTPTQDTFINEGPTTILSIEQTPKDKVADNQTKANTDLAKKAESALQLETDTLKATQKSLQEKISEAGSVTNYVTQAGGWDKFIREMYDKQNVK
jgi:hypothetical protein